MTTVLLGVGTGLAVVASEHFRRGAVIIAAAVLYGALLRMLLPPRVAGLLVVRHRAFDVATLGLLGLGLLVLALVVPPPR